MTKSLKIRMNGIHAADLSQEERTGRLTIAYVKSWLADPRSACLSVRMPLRAEPYRDDVAVPFVSGLLPDSKVHRKMIGSMLGVSGDNDFALLAEIGRECAGAVSLVPPDEPDEPEHSVVPSYDVLDEARTAKLVRELPGRPLLLDGGEIRLSLAGVQDKAAVVQADGRIGMPIHGTPSTHILKRDIPGLPDSIRTEHFCLRLAAAVGIPTPKSRICTAEDEVFMLVSRYDRKLVARSDGPRLIRLHQEDLCQALGYVPDMKYEREGGPDWKQFFDMAAGACEDPAIRIRLADVAILQWLIDNPDAHGKNYSFLYKGAGKVDLAPVYDLNNASAFRDRFKRVTPRLAMSVGGTFDPLAIGPEHWQRFSADAGMKWPIVKSRIARLADALPKAAANLEAEYRDTVAWSPRLPLVVEDVTRRCARVEAMLEGRAVPEHDREHEAWASEPGSTPAP